MAASDSEVSTYAIGLGNNMVITLICCDVLVVVSQPSRGGGGVGRWCFSSHNHDSGCGVVFHHHHVPSRAAEQPVGNKINPVFVRSCLSISKPAVGPVPAIPEGGRGPQVSYPLRQPQIATTAPHDQGETRTSQSSKIHRCLVKSWIWNGANVRMIARV